ncbi:MAG: metallophosphoesterase family protein [Vicinamibacterales bacterium]
MRIAVVSDVHGNLTALEAVVADLAGVGADLVVQGGDLVANGSSPAEVLDRVRDLGWPGVVGNTDEMLWDEAPLVALIDRAPRLGPLLRALRTDVIPATVAALGDNRLAWLRAMPPAWAGGGLTVVHASPGDCWRSPQVEAADEELAAAYGGLRSRHVVYGHIHRPFVRTLPASIVAHAGARGLPWVVANAGSVGLPYDGDRRASYAVVDEDGVAIRRVAYDVDREIRMLLARAAPQAAWLARVLRAGAYVPPDEPGA